MENNPQTGLEIAVIGMAGRFPGAKNISQFWENLKNGVESLIFYSDKDLEKQGVGYELIENPGFVKTAGGVLEDIEYFDASFFNYTPGEAEQMSPQIRIFHECAWTALEDAGYEPDSHNGLIGLYAGILSTVNWERLLSVAASSGRLPPSTAFYLDKRDFFSTLVAYKLNLQGPAFIMNCACSTSLLAIHLACQGLLSGDCDIALAGGVAVRFTKSFGYFYQEGMISSPDGHCRAFDADAGGTAGGSGIGIVVLKRLEEAISDRDNIYAVIKGSAINNDGKRKVGYTAPSVEGQVQVIRKAHQISGVNPGDIGYVEAHGTGTPLGDITEFEALKQAFNTNKKHSCGIGSVKTNVGHLDTAAGVTGFIKAVLALKHKQIPASLNFKEPNPRIDFENSPFYVNTNLKEWKNNGRPLGAGVSSFGIGGTNVHLVVEEAPPLNKNTLQQSTRKYKLLLLSAKTQTALDHMTRNLTQYLKNNPHIHLEDAAYTLQVGRKHFQHRRKLPCTGVSDALAALSAPDSREIRTHRSKKEKKNPVFMFSGLGQQYVNMGLGLYETEPVFRKEMDQCFHILHQVTGILLKDIFYPTDRAEPEKLMQQTEISQYVIFTLEYSLTRLLMDWGLNPHAMIGYSFGEYVCACISGVFSLEDALRLLVVRGLLIRELPPGMMLSVPLPPGEVQPFLDEQLAIGIDNGSSCVVSGATAAIRSLEKRLKEQKVMCMPLDSTHAIHSPMMDPVLKKFEQQMGTIPLHPPQIPYISGVTGTWINVEDATSPAYWAKQLRETVRFSQGLENLVKEPGMIFLEIGPGHDISALVKRHLDRESPQPVISLVRHPQKDIPDDYYLLDKIGLLWLHGVEIDWKRYYGDEKPYRLSLPTYPFQSKRFWKLVEDYESGQFRDEDKSRGISERFYSPLWQRKKLPHQKNKEKTGELIWLIFTDSSGWGDRLAAQLKKEQTVITVKSHSDYSKQNTTEYSIHPGQYDDYELLLKEIASSALIPTHIVHLWSVGSDKPGKSEPEDIKKSQESGFFSLLFLGRALGRNPNYTGKIDISIITNNMQEVTGDEMLMPGKATVIGPCKVIPQEYPNLSCRSIDIDIDMVNRPGAEPVNQLIREISSQPGDTVVAFRGNNRWVRIFHRTPLDIVEKPPLIREEGVYLVAGGLGDIGYALAESLVRGFRAKLILTGRSQLPPKQMWQQYLIISDEHDKQAQNIQKMLQLEELGGKILYYSADLSDRTRMQEVIRQGEENFGPLNGVIHSAGLVRDQSLSPIENIDISQCHQQFKTRLQGTLVLEELLRDKDPDFCLIISSIAVVLGGLGFVAYAGANYFMDIFSLQCNRKNREKWIIVNWDGTNRQDTVRAFHHILSADSLEHILFCARGDLEERIAQWVKMEGIKTGEQTKGEEKAALDERPELSNPYVAPGNAAERKLAAIWQNFFGIEKIGVTDDLFDLGGDSLKAINIISIIHRELNVTIPIREFFDHSTIEGVARYLTGAEKSDYTSIEPAEKKDYYELSPAQERMYILQQMDLNSIAYNSPLVETLEKNIDKNQLEKTFKQLIQRHESLRTSVIVINNNPVQRIHESMDFQLEYYKKNSRGSRVKEIITNFVRPFDLSRPPLLRVGLIDLPETGYVLLIDIHHMVTDGVSHEILVGEFKKLYTGEELSPLRLQYKDYAQWQNSEPQKQAGKLQEAYWLKEFAGNIPVLKLHTDYERPPVQNFEGNSLNFEIGEEDTKALREIASREGTTMFMTLLALYVIMLAKLSGQEDIVVGIPVAGRRHADLDRIIGVFVNTLPIRNYPMGSDTFKQFLYKVKEKTLKAFDNQDYPFNLLVDKISVPRNTGRNPVFDVVFNLLNQSEHTGKLPQPREENSPHNDQSKNVTSKFDFSLLVIEFKEKLSIIVEYSTKLFKKNTIDTYLKHFEKIIKRVTGNNEIKIRDIDLVVKEEKDEILSKIQEDINDIDTLFNI